MIRKYNDVTNTNMSCMRSNNIHRKTEGKVHINKVYQKKTKEKRTKIETEKPSLAYNCLRANTPQFNKGLYQ